MKLIDLFEKQKFALTRINGDKWDYDDEDIINWCKKNASEYLSDPVPIFRGDGFGHEAIYHTKDFDRVSKNTLNYYTQWMDNHSQWNAYPKRSKSLICTTSLDTAHGYHQKVFRVIPSNDCKIGVVPAADLWYGFQPLRSFFKNAGITGHRSSSMDNMVSSLQYIIGLTLGDHVTEPEQGHDLGQSPLEKSWPALQAALKEITTDLILDVVSEGELKTTQLRALSLLAKKMNRSGYDSLYDALEAQMDPSLNKFKVVGPGQIPAEDDCELWIGGGDCLLIQEKSYRGDLFHKLGLI